MDQNNRRTSSSSSSKPDRKTVEKNRRNQMKNLFTHLNSLLPHHHGSTSRENMSLPGQIEEATNYIKKMQAQIERLKEKKSSLLTSSSGNSSNSAGGSNLQQRWNSNTDCGLKPPQIEVHLAGDSALQIVLITGVDCQLIFTEALRVLHDEGAEVVNASFSVMDESTVYHTIHAKIEECSEHQVAIARITERLNTVCN